MFFWAARRRGALLGCEFPEPVPVLTEEDVDEGWGANVAKLVD